MNFLRVAFSAVVAGCALFARAGANTWYVDDDNYGKEGLDGKSETTAFGTIQAAIGAATAGDTIFVAEGTYDQGSTEVSGDQGANCTARVYIDRNVTIKASGRKTFTHIVGNRSADAPVACVASDGSNFHLEGVTLRNGRPKANQKGGAVNYACYISPEQTKSTHLYDCTVSNCYSEVGEIIQRATLNRCLVAYNTGASCAGVAEGYAANTIFMCNAGPAVKEGLGTVNCTIVGGNDKYKPSSTARNVYGSIYTMNGFNYDSSESTISFNHSVSSESDQAKRFPNSPTSTSGSLYGVGSTNLFVAPAFGDFRLVAGSVAIDLAKSADLANVALPAGYVQKDYLGNAIDTTKENINAGAIQTVVTPEGGLTVFSANWYDSITYVAVDGRPIRSGYLNYAYAETWPAQLRVTGLSATHPLACALDSVSGRRRFVGMDGALWIMPSASGKVKTVTFETAYATFYVNPDGDNAKDGKTPETAWRTLLYAATNSSVTIEKRVRLVCAAGTYAEGSYNASRVNIPSSSNYKLHYFAEAGAEKTFLEGQIGTGDNQLANGLRCVTCGAPPGVGFTGFTLRNARTSGSGCILAQSSQIGLTDCIVTNNIASSCVTYGTVTADRCRIEDNHDYNQGCLDGALLLCGCLVRNNHSLSNTRSALRGYSGPLRAVNCTFADTTASTVASYFVNHSDTAYFYNCVMVDLIDVLDLNVASAGNLYRNCTGGHLPGYAGFTAGDPLFVGKPRADYRLAAASPARMCAVTTFDGFTEYGGCDFYGNSTLKNGVPVAGAFAEIPTNEVTVADADSRLTVTGLADGCRAIYPGETLTVAPNAASTRPVVGWTTDGGATTNLFGDAAGVSYTYEQIAAAGGLAISGPILGTEWFANANTDPAAGTVGSDTNHGFSAAFPKQTLAAAVANAASGDTVWAAAGTYDEGYVTDGNRSRVRVPAGVALMASDPQGAEVTTILGASDPSDATDGYGANAIRCAMLNSNAVLEGFTLRGGRVIGTVDASYAISGSAVGCGYGASGAVARNCIITDCRAPRGVVFAVTLRHCILRENTVTYQDLVYKGSTYNCLFTRNYSNRLILNGGAHENDTWANDNMNLGGTATFGYSVAQYFSSLKNCLIFGKVDDGNVINCCFSELGEIRSDKFVNCIKTTAAKIALGADYVPALTSAAVDKGTVATLTGADTDLGGNPRISNGTIDIGAYEADWRPQYTKDVCRRSTVTEASPCVVETTRADGKKGVSLGADGTLIVACDRGAGETSRCRFKFEVTGSGVLTVEPEGGAAQTFTYAEGRQTCFVRGTGPQNVRLTYTPGTDDTGTAELIRASLASGGVFYVR